MTAPLPTPDEFLNQGGVVSASFDGPPPIRYEGTVSGEPQLVQQRNLDNNKPKYWSPDNKPTEEPNDPATGQPNRQMLQLAVRLQTTQRDPAVPDDDGIRGVYLSYKKQDAAKAALKEAGMKGLHDGDWFALEFYSEDMTQQVARGKNRTKLYRAEARKGVPNQDGVWNQGQGQPTDGWGQPAPAAYPVALPAYTQPGSTPPQGYQQPPVQQAPQPAPVAAPVGFDEDTLNALPPAAIQTLKANGQLDPNWAPRA